MPSFHHEILVELFRENGKLAAELLRACAGIAIDHHRIERGSIDLSQVVPAEYRADNVAVLHSRNGRPITGLIVEVQLQRDRDKLLAWPVYVAALRAQLDCPAVLLVIAPQAVVAMRARRSIPKRARPIIEIGAWSARYDAAPRRIGHQVTASAPPPIRLGGRADNHARSSCAIHCVQLASTVGYRSR